MRIRRERPVLENPTRAGVATLWLILALPVFLVLMAFIVDIANLWLARVELKNALDATSLAAVREWSQTSGLYDTQPARIIGRTYAAANTINGVPLQIGLNYDPNEPPNQNAACEGDLIFGAIVDLDGNDSTFEFDSCQVPACGFGRIVLDVTGQGNLSNGEFNEWGISFQPSFTPIPDNFNVRLLRVIYRLPPTCVLPNGSVANPVFALDPLPQVSSNTTDVTGGGNIGNAVQCRSGPGTKFAQADIKGLVGSDVQFYVNIPVDPDPNDDNDTDCTLDVSQFTSVTSPTAPLVSKSLAVVFPNNPGELGGFDPTDRVRFGAFVRNLNANGQGQQFDADEIGHCGTTITMCFSDGTVLKGQFVDTMDDGNLSYACEAVQFAPWGSSTSPLSGMIVHPTVGPDIPYPGPSPTNNGQSLSRFELNGGGTGLAYAVRAQATIQVPSVWCDLCGGLFGPFTIQAKSDAYIDCGSCNPRLVHLSQFLCNVPCP